VLIKIRQISSVAMSKEKMKIETNVMTVRKSTKIQPIVNAREIRIRKCVKIVMEKIKMILLVTTVLDKGKILSFASVKRILIKRCALIA